MKERAIFIEGVDSLEEEEEFQKLLDQAELEKSVLQFPRGYLSVSQVNMFMRCGLQYKFRYVDDVISPPGVSLVEGTSMHKALEVGLREKMDTSKIPPVDVMRDAWRDTWKKRHTDIQDWGDDGKVKASAAAEKHGMSFVTMYHRDNLPKTYPLGVEQRFWTSVGAHNIPTLGYIDLVDQEKIDLVDGKTVVDHKIVRATKSQADADSDLQLTLYSEVSDTRHVRFDCFVKTKSPKIKTVKSTRKRADYKWMSTVFDRVAEAINAGIFLPCDPTSWACTPKFCGYYRMCRGKKK
jgi:hypothetical protein